MANDGGQSCWPRLCSGSAHHDLPVCLESIYWTSLWLFSSFTKNQSQLPSPRPILFRPFTSFDILSVLVANPYYGSTAMSLFMEVSFLVIRSHWEVSVCCLCMHVRYTSSGGSPRFLLWSEINKSHSSVHTQKRIRNEENIWAGRGGEKLLLKGMEQDCIINFNLHCTAPTVIYLREWGLRGSRASADTRWRPAQCSSLSSGPPVIQSMSLSSLLMAHLIKN